MYFNGKAHPDRNNPRATAVCDRCANWYQHNELRWQYEYAGTSTYNTRFLVCDKCYDTPNQQFKTVRLPADPLPIKDPRIENFASENASTSYVVAEIINGAWALVVL